MSPMFDEPDDEQVDIDCHIGYIEYDYEDSHEPTAANVATPNRWDGVIRKEPKISPKKYTHVPSLFKLCADILPISVRVQLPTYFPGSLDHM